jgi:hypothetical protein
MLEFLVSCAIEAVLDSDEQGQLIIEDFIR